MARRNTFGEDFRRGFDWGYKMMGNYQSARDIRDLEDEEVEAQYDPNKYAKRMGLQNDLQAQMLAEQDREFGLDATRNTAAALNMVSGDPTPAQAGGFNPDSYSYLGKTYEKRPTDIQQEYARGMKESDIYRRYGLYDRARQTKSDARTGRAADMQYESTKIELGQKKQLDNINKLFIKVKAGDPKAIAEMMQIAAPVYNGEAVTDDNNVVKFDANGKPLIFGAGSDQGQDPIAFLNKLPKEQQQEAYKMLHMYAKAAVTGNYKEINKYQLAQEKLGLDKKKAAIDAKYKKALIDYYSIKGTSSGSSSSGSDGQNTWYDNMINAQKVYSEAIKQAQEAALLSEDNSVPAAIQVNVDRAAKLFQDAKDKYLTTITPTGLKGKKAQPDADSAVQIRRVDPNTNEAWVFNKELWKWERE